VPESRRTGFPMSEERGPPSAADPASPRSPGESPRLPVHARLPRRMAPAVSLGRAHQGATERQGLQASSPPSTPRRSPDAAPEFSGKSPDPAQRHEEPVACWRSAGRMLHDPRADPAPGRSSPPRRLVSSELCTRRLNGNANLTGILVNCWRGTSALNVTFPDCYRL
jgi:hypothetical protein